MLRSAKPDVMDVQRYPLFDEGTASFQARYFTPINIPVFDERGEVGWIVHRVEEVTEYVTTRPATLSDTGAETAAAALYARTRDLVRRNLELAIRAGHDREVSRILQEAMLTDLPEPDHLSLAARYVANIDTAQVGGDWYDAAVLPDGSTMIAVGDVVGHDINVAVVWASRADCCGRSPGTEQNLHRRSSPGWSAAWPGSRSTPSPRSYSVVSSRPRRTGPAVCVGSAGPMPATHRLSWFARTAPWLSWRPATTSCSAPASTTPAATTYRNSPPGLVPDSRHLTVSSNGGAAT